MEVVNNNSLPKISIVTPSYNQAEFLECTILSVINQDYPNLEYIIVDGGSTDGSVDIIKKYEKYITYWVSEPDRGQSDAINKGFDKSSGDIVAWLNSDDVYLPGAIWKIVKIFQENKKASLVYGDYIKIDEYDKCVALRRQPSFNYKICLYGYLTVMQPASFFKRKVFFDAGGIDVNFNYTMDFDIILKLARLGEVVHVRDYLAAFRLHKKSKSVSQKRMLRVESYKARMKHLNYKRLGLLPVLFRVYQLFAAIKMLREGCWPSRFVKEDRGYKIGEKYGLYKGVNNDS
jgi:glycosyltransferase involved in cell wall biosynthesis